MVDLLRGHGVGLLSVQGGVVSVFEDCLLLESVWFKLLVKLGSSACGFNMRGNATSMFIIDEAVAKTYGYCGFHGTIR